MSHEESLCTCSVAAGSVDKTRGARRLEGGPADTRVLSETVWQVMDEGFKFFFLAIPRGMWDLVF